MQVHQREQCECVRLGANRVLRQQRGDPNGLVAQLVANRLLRMRRQISLVEEQIQHGVHGWQPGFQRVEWRRVHIAARIAMVQELTIPILLFLGLATRLATLPLLGMIAVIQTFVYPNAYNEHLVWGAILVLLLTRGPGVLSVDYLIGKYAKKRFWRRHME
jgi:uncharacterized membrane protein YphA (DoxX/SURF4 family)